MLFLFNAYKSTTMSSSVEDVWIKSGILYILVNLVLLKFCPLNGVHRCPSSGQQLLCLPPSLPTP